MRHYHTILIRCLFGLLLGTVSSTYAQPQKVKAKNGEGVTLLLQRYQLQPKLYEAEFRKLNKGKFTADGGLKMGITYLLPTKRPSSRKENQQDPLKASPIQKQPAKGKQPSPKKVADKENQDDVRTPMPDNSNRRQEKATKGYEPLFGKSYAHYGKPTNELKNAVFYLVSGHGGPDPGAIGLYKGYRLHEDEYAYDIILRLGKELLLMGAKVYFIIQDPKDGIRDEAVLKNSKEETCRGKAIPLDQIKRLNQRCEAINRLYNQDRAAYKRAVFIHVDSRSKGKQTDVFFYHSPGSSNGKQLAKSIQQTFDRKYDKHQPNRGFNGTVSERNLHVLRNSTPAAVFLELGNIQNQRDQQRLVLNSNRQALARWIAEGILADYQKGRK